GAIARACNSDGLTAVCLRYFNAAGCEPEAGIGEVHDPETHLIPNLVKAALSPNMEPATIFGGDYATPDGTCVRDYIHVSDLCEAHLRALAHIESHPGMHVFNLGAGKGSSVLDVLKACRSISGMAIPERTLARREGD